MTWGCQACHGRLGQASVGKASGGATSVGKEFTESWLAKASPRTGRAWLVPAGRGRHGEDLFHQINLAGLVADWLGVVWHAKARVSFMDGFDYDKVNEFEKTIGPIEEVVIRSQFATVVDGNDSFAERSSAEMRDAYWLFRHGWICCRLAMLGITPV